MYSEIGVKLKSMSKNLAVIAHFLYDAANEFWYFSKKKYVWVEKSDTLKEWKTMQMKKQYEDELMD